MARYSQFIPPSQPTTTGRQLPTSVPLPLLPAVEAAKRLAAFAAVDQNIGLEQKVSVEGFITFDSPIYRSCLGWRP